MRACMREARASLTRTSASSARPSVTSSRSSGMGAARSSPRRKTSAGWRSPSPARGFGTEPAVKVLSPGSLLISGASGAKDLERGLGRAGTSLARRLFPRILARRARALQRKSARRRWPSGARSLYDSRRAPAARLLQARDFRGGAAREVRMASIRSLTRGWLPQDFKKYFQRVLLGYDSYAPSFASAGEDMILRHVIGSDRMEGFYVDVGAYHPVDRKSTRLN